MGFFSYEILPVAWSVFDTAQIHNLFLAVGAHTVRAEDVGSNWWIKSCVAA